MIIKENLKKQADEILNMAEKKGVQTNFFFITTFQRYMVQIDLLDRLEAEINSIGMTVKKEYVKGRENVCANPAIDTYNKTSNAANQTVATLIKIVKGFEDNDQDDELMAFIKGNK